MPGGRLRMKATTASEAGPKRKRRRATPDDGAGTGFAAALLSLSPEPGPSRPSRDRSPVPKSARGVYYGVGAGDDDLDESALPPPQATRSEPPDDDDAEFTRRLFEEMREDEGADAWSAYYDPPPSVYVPNRFRAEGSQASHYYDSGGGNGVRQERVINRHGAVVTRVIFDQAMDDEEYAEQIRAGMWQRTHAESLRRTEAIRLEAQKRDERRRAEREQARRDEAARVRRLEDTVRRQTMARDEDARAAYAKAWQRLLDPARGDEPLRAADFVWPIPGGGEGALDASSVERFLLGHIARSETRARRGALRLAVLAYHPDRFDRLLARVPEAGNERASVREMGLRVSQLLNELLSTVTV